MTVTVDPIDIKFCDFGEISNKGDNLSIFNDIIKDIVAMASDLAFIFFHSELPSGGTTFGALLKVRIFRCKIHLEKTCKDKDK